MTWDDLQKLRRECSETRRFGTGAAIAAPASGGPLHRYARGRKRRGIARARARCAQRRRRCAGPAGGQDRKSTRLNSSHLVISYAVFCLKKKKQQLNVSIHYAHGPMSTAR